MKTLESDLRALVAEIDARFVWDSVPVERAHITRDEWKVIESLLSRAGARTAGEAEGPGHKHSCREWDGLVIQDGDPEMAACKCFARPAIYLVPADNTEGPQLYERYEGAPPPLCDYEGPLYATAPSISNPTPNAESCARPSREGG